MRDVGPPGARSCRSARPRRRAARSGTPSTARRSARRPARPASRRSVCTRCSKRFIAIWRNTVATAPSTVSVSSASRESGVSACSSRRPKTICSPNTLAVSASVSGVLMWNTPWRRAERRVHAVAELVRERHHVAALVGVVEQHVRVRRGHRVGAERPAALVRAHRRVDPALVEEALHDAAELARERAVGVEHEVARLAPADVLLVVGDGREPVVVGELVDARAAAPSAGTSGAAPRSARGPPRRAPARTRRRPRWRGCGWRASSGTSAAGPRPSCPPAAC